MSGLKLQVVKMTEEELLKLSDNLFTIIDSLEIINFLPNDITIEKSTYITKDGFDIDGFNSLLFKTYNTLYPVSDGRRYKK